MKSFILFICCILISSICLSQSELSAIEVLDKSIKYHDPKGKLSSSSWEMHYEDLSYFKYDPKTNNGEIKRTIKNYEVVLKVEGDSFTAHVDGSTDLSEVDINPKYTSKERALMMRNYYHYLWFLPMKLKDYGTIILDKVKTTDFFGKYSLQIKVTYDPKIGKDIWYFYFNPVSFALQGYRFYHDEKANDGEYILLEGEVSHKSVKIPKARKWYTHKEDKFLGEDVLIKLILN